MESAFYARSLNGKFALRGVRSIRDFRVTKKIIIIIGVVLIHISIDQSLSQDSSTIREVREKRLEEVIAQDPFEYASAEIFYRMRFYRTRITRVVSTRTEISVEERFVSLELSPANFGSHDGDPGSQQFRTRGRPETNPSALIPRV